MNKKHLIIAASVFAFVLTSGGIWHFSKESASTNRTGTDDALLALIKNDQNAFESWIKNGGDLSAFLPVIDGKKLTVAEGLAYFERANFIQHLQDQKISFLKQSTDGKDDIMSIAVGKNNPELLALLLKEKPNLTALYGKNGMTLLHLASSGCASKLTSLLHSDKGVSWDHKAKDGSTPLTLAAGVDCLPMLSYWKEQGADFSKKDGRGQSAMSIMRKKKDAAMVAFLQSFEPRTRAPASVGPAIVKEPNFYKKRVVPADQKIDYSALIEPEDRPLDAVETAEQSEFAD